MTLVDVLLWAIIVLAAISALFRATRIRTDKPRRIRAIAARIYFILVYLAIGILALSLDTSRLLVRLGLVALFLDDAISQFEIFLRKRNNAP